MVITGFSGNTYVVAATGGNLAASANAANIVVPARTRPLIAKELFEHAGAILEVGDIIRDGDPPARKALLQALIAEIRIESRAVIRPTFAIPAVDDLHLVPPRGFEPRFPP